MDHLQSYLFENSQDIPENHYINMMNLLLKVYKDKNTIPPPQIVYQERIVYREQPIVYREQPIVIRERSPRVILYEMDHINNLRRECGITSEKMIITERFYNDNLKNIVTSEASNADELFINQLKSLLIDWEPTHFVFPNYVNKSDRQLIHIMSKSGNLFKSKTTEYTSIYKDVGVLNIFIR
jgi:hypothetical protein